MKPTSRQPTEKDVIRANRRVYNSRSIEWYNADSSIFNPNQQQEIRAILEDIKQRTRGERFLDVGCGTGNLLKIARDIFPEILGVDVAEHLLAEVARREGLGQLISAEADHLPLPDCCLDCVGLFAVMHHMMDPLPALREAFRVLRPGGILYTDHDINHYCSRFYHLWHLLRYRKRIAFHSAEEDLAEYHNVHTSGLNADTLRSGLLDIGFEHVEIKYHNSTREDLAGIYRFALPAMKAVTKILPLASLHTHFLILATK